MTNLKLTTIVFTLITFITLSLSTTEIFAQTYQQGLNITGHGITIKSTADHISNLRLVNDSEELLGGFQARKFSPTTFNSGLLDKDGSFNYLHQSNNFTQFRISNDTKMMVFKDGKVAIGNIGKFDPMIQKVGGGVFNPADSTYNVNSVDIGSDQYKLIVQTGILTEKVKVAGLTTADWADYVFEEDYEMLPIGELEDYITENKHLPNVPSAKEVAENGLDLAKTDATLLEKIEESYLYIIELNKKFDALEAENNNLKKALQKSKN